MNKDIKDIRIRPATYADREAIAQLHVAGWRTTYAPALNPAYLEADVVTDRRTTWNERLSAPAPNQRVLVACEGDEVLAFGCAFLNFDPEWGSILDNLHVRRDLQGLGLGTRLLHDIARICATETPTLPMHLWVLHVNVSAQGFYQRYGAQNGGTITWNAPEGSQVPVWRYYWPAGQLPLGD
ncbi:MAG: GNAT family N-acetyltransferase [Pseudomonadota bacterium]